MSDADDLLSGERFVCADCVWLDGRFVALAVEGDAVDPRPAVAVDTDDLTDVFTTFRREVDAVVYGGGEASAHGSCGFFFKRRGERLEWALMSLDSEPFVGVEVGSMQVRFRTQSGDAWIVDADAPDRARIVRAR